MYNREENPLLAPSAVFLIAISHSIGWGIRGNFGHESGAMIAGVLSAIAVAVLSRRDDWRRRVPYFALLGGLGWGFGGSISYMYPFSFTESGQTLSTFYGYFAVFIVGGLWCGMGVAGTALAATMPRERLQRFILPLCFVLVFVGFRAWITDPLSELLTPTGGAEADDTWHRHESPLYWFDADWLAALAALAGVCAFDLYDRLGGKHATRIERPIFVLPYIIGGALAGSILQWLSRLVGLEGKIASLLTVPLGDLSYVNPETGSGFDPDQLLTNWPQFFSDYPQHLGWGFGAMAGAAVYFMLTGRFRRDSSLLLWLALGWIAGFILLPVLGSLFLMNYGGLRLMPPRSDDWAGILGVFVAGLFWARSHGLYVISVAMSRGFIFGGIAFASVPMLRYFMRFPGHPWRYPDGVPKLWAHYQSANWHSVMEQLHGFGFGIVVAVAMAMVWRGVVPEAKWVSAKRWNELVAVVFVLFGITYLNLHKLVGTWVNNEAVPAMLKAPWVGFVEAEPLVWFRVVWWTAAAVFAVLLVIHRRRRFEVIPVSWLGRGQLLYVLFLWLMVIGNLLRAIPGFTNGRMITEWVLFMNASVATLLVVLVPRSPLHPSIWRAESAWPGLGIVWRRGLFRAGVLMVIYGSVTLLLYQEHVEGKPWANHRRFGEDAKWRVEPILKQGEHP